MNRTPVNSSVNRSKPPVGIVCPKCGANIFGPIPKRHRKRVKGKGGHIVYTRARKGSLYRIRRCIVCENRVMTVERIESNACR